MKLAIEALVRGVWCYILAENSLGINIADPLTGKIIAVFWTDVEAIR